MDVLKYIGLAIFIVIALAIVFMCIRMATLGFESRAVKPNLGLVDGRLKACPDSPNCVNSYADDEPHAVESIQGGIASLVGLAHHIKSLENTELVNQTDNYLHATFHSKLIGFVDDLELYYDGSSIQVRSASRVGYSDLNANRKRVNHLREVAKKLRVD